MAMQAQQNVPAIAIDLLNLKYAKESGDKMRAEIAQQKFDAKLSQTQAKKREKEYNTLGSQYIKAFNALKESEINIEKVKQGLSVEKEVVTQQGAIAVEGLKQEGETARQEWLNVTFATDLRELGIDEKTINQMLKAKAGVPQQHESAVMLKYIFESGAIPREQQMTVWNSYNKIPPGAGSGGGTGSKAGGGGSYSDTEQRERARAVMNKMIAQAPVETTVEKNNWGPIPGKHDETEGTAPTSQQMYDYAYKMADTALNIGLPPKHLYEALEVALSEAEALLRVGVGGHDAGDVESGGVELPGADKGESQTESDAKFIRAQKTVNFFYSDAGKQFLRWLRRSRDAGGFVAPRWTTPQQPTAPSNPDGAPSPANPVQPGMPPTDETPGAPPSTSNVPGSPVSQGAPKTTMTSREKAEKLRKSGMITPGQRVDRDKTREMGLNHVMKTGAREGIVENGVVVYQPRGNANTNQYMRAGDTFNVIRFGLKGVDGFKVTGVRLLREMSTGRRMRAFGQPQFFNVPITEFKNFQRAK